MKKAMTAGAGKAFTAKVDAKGKVVELMDDAKELLKDSGGGGRMMGGAAMSEESLKELVSSAFGELPAKPVAVGGKWERSDQDSGGRMPSNNKFDLTLAKADAESFEVTIAGTVEKPAAPAAPADADKIEGDDEQAEMQREMMKSMQMKNGKIAGLCKASRTDGFVTEANLTISMDVEMSAGQMGDMAMSIKIVKSMKRTTEAAAAPKKAEPKKDEAKPAAPTTGGGK
jgi:hypothetical protein